MIVVDSSVWIANLQNRASQAVLNLRLLDDADLILVGDLILLEVLQGARDEAHAAQVERNMRHFAIVSMLNGALAVRAAENYRRLRRLGVTVRKTVDIVIATFCIEHGHALLHEDRDFTPMVQHLGLRVVE